MLNSVFVGIPELLTAVSLVKYSMPSSLRTFRFSVVVISKPPENEPMYSLVKHKITLTNICATVPNDAL